MQRAFDLIKQRLEEERHPEICGGWENLRIDRAIEIVNQVATEYFKENYFNLDNTKLHDCPKCGEKATHRVNKKGSWACGCFKCGLFKSSYDHAKAIQAWEDYCGEYGGGWIPVEERLPEERGLYKVRNQQGIETTAYYVRIRIECEKLPFSNLREYNGYVPKWLYVDFDENSCSKNRVLNNVFAWQPLPPSYQQKGE